MGNPIELMWSWQALLVSITAAGIVQFLKVVIDIAWGHFSKEETPTIKARLSVGRDKRSGNKILDRLVMPALGPVVGALITLFIHVYPEVLQTYVESMIEKGAMTSGWAIYMLWGGGCGQFADYAVTKVKRALGMDAPKAEKADDEEEPEEESKAA